MKDLFEACWILKIITPTDLSGLQNKLWLGVWGKKPHCLVYLAAVIAGWLRAGTTSSFWGELFLGEIEGYKSWCQIYVISLWLLPASLNPNSPAENLASRYLWSIVCFFSCVRLKYVAVILYDRLLEVKHHDFANLLSSSCDNYIKYYTAFTLWPNG